MTHQSQSLYLTAPRTLTWLDETLPVLGAHDVLLETIASSISPGTELPQYRADERTSEAVTYPRMTGYENYARVIDTGSAVTKWRIGDRVFAFYGHRTHAILHEERPIAVPDDTPAEVALSAILTCDVAKGIRRLRPLPETRILVTGAGVIGLFTVLMLKAYGVEQVDVVEPLSERRQLAAEFGASRLFAATDHPTVEYDTALECSGRQAAFALLQRQLVQGGQVCILSDGNIEPLVLLPEFHRKELTIIGSSDGWDYHRHAIWFFDHVQQKNPPLSKLFDLHINYTRLPDTFARLADAPQSAIKVLVTYSC